MRVALVLAAAGESSRLTGAEPKQSRLLGGIPVLEWTLHTAASVPEFHCVVAVLPSGIEDKIALGIDLPVHAVTGGCTRYESVRRGLDEALRRGCDTALVHDAARPFAGVQLFRRVIDELGRGAAAVVPVVPVSDTIKRLDGASPTTIPREGLWRAQTPQGILIEKVLESYDAVAGPEGPRGRQGSPEPPTDEAAMAEIGGLDVVTVEGDLLNLKITYDEDWAVAEAMVAQGIVQTPGRDRSLPLPERNLVLPVGGASGVGFDAHRLVEGVPLFLGGVRIPHPRGLHGHSDGDAVSHAVADALLGAAHLGDIGTLYPASDDRNRGRQSTEFLREIVAILHERGLSISSVDVTVIAEEPRLEPYKEAIRRALAGALSIDTSEVSVKATTTDGLGITGSGGGIAALATAVVAPYHIESLRQSSSKR